MAVLASIVRRRHQEPVPDERPEYGQVLATNDTGAPTSGTLPLALNDPPGKWTIAATETVTKTTATAEFVVASAP